MASKTKNKQKKKKIYKLINYHCPTCNNWLITIPEEFIKGFKTPCKNCHGWEQQYNYELYLLKEDKSRYYQYLEALKKRLLQE